MKMFLGKEKALRELGVKLAEFRRGLCSGFVTTLGVDPQPRLALTKIRLSHSTS